jgi:hypothetical protein
MLPRIPAVVTFFFILLLFGCGERPQEPATSPEPAKPSDLVEVTARGLTFEAPESVPSGWLTFRFNNASPMTHFALIERMPEGKGIAEQQEEVAPLFQAGMDLLNEGKVDDALGEFGKLPEWFGQIEFLGGPGLTAPGHVSETTLKLDPGTYLIECYVKTGGVFHSYNPVDSLYGMVHEFTVSSDTSAGTKPTPTLHVMISSERGIEMAEEPTAGPQIAAVRFEDQTVHENFVGHDVHLVRLQDDTDMEALASWMDWSKPGGLETPAPAEFIGGTNEMPAGSTAYVPVTLEPGRYAWIAEVPSSDEKGMLLEFTVAG